MNSVLIIAQNTFKELIRDKILFVLLFFGFFLLLVSFLLSNLTLNERIKIAIDFGISALHLTMVVLAIFLGSTLIFREIDKKTIFFVMSYPISRTQFIIGKFLGFITMLIGIEFFLSLGLMLLISSLGWKLHLSYFIALIGIFFEVMILLSATLMLGVLVRPIIVVGSVVGLFLIGHGMNSFYEIAQKSSHALLRTSSEIMMWMAPNLSHTNWINLVSFDQILAREYLLKGMMYAAGWTLLFLILSILFFRRKDFV